MSECYKKSNKQAGFHTSHKLAHQTKANLHNTESQVTSKKGEVEKSSNGDKVNIGLLRKVVRLGLAYQHQKEDSPQWRSD